MLAFLPDGSDMTFEEARGLGVDDPKRAMRVRSLEGVAIPSDRLHRGVNVLSIRIVRSPYPKVVDEQRDQNWASGTTPGILARLRMYG
jgi:hypothetical protein